MARTEIQMLGPFNVTHNSQPVSFSYDKVRALLAYLCVEYKQPITRTRLTGLLWPDQSQTAAQDSLRQAISRLRKDLHDRDSHPPVLIVERDTLQLKSGKQRHHRPHHLSRLSFPDGFPPSPQAANLYLLHCIVGKSGQPG